MRRLVLDSHAIVGWIKGESCAGVVALRLEEAEQGQVLLYLSAINAGEIYYVLNKRHSRSIAAAWEKELLPSLPIQTVRPDFEAIFAAAKLKAQYPISYADAFAASLTLTHAAPLLTGDSGFRAKAIQVLRLDWLGN